MNKRQILLELIAEWNLANPEERIEYHEITTLEDDYFPIKVSLYSRGQSVVAIKEENIEAAAAYMLKYLVHSGIQRYA